MICAQNAGCKHPILACQRCRCWPPRSAVSGLCQSWAPLGFSEVRTVSRPVFRGSNVSMAICKHLLSGHSCCEDYEGLDPCSAQVTPAHPAVSAQGSPFPRSLLDSTPDRSMCPFSVCQAASFIAYSGTYHSVMQSSFTHLAPSLGCVLLLAGPAPHSSV